MLRDGGLERDDKDDEKQEIAAHQGLVIATKHQALGGVNRKLTPFSQVKKG